MRCFRINQEKSTATEILDDSRILETIFIKHNLVSNTLG